MATPTALWTNVRNCIDTEVRVLSWIQADAAKDSGMPGTPPDPPAVKEQDASEEPGRDGATSQRADGLVLADLDSFSFVQLVLSLEAEFDVELLEELGDFRGENFDDVADFVTGQVERVRAAPQAR